MPDLYASERNLLQAPSEGKPITEAEVRVLTDRLTRVRAARDQHLAWVHRLIEAIDELGMYEPGRKGYAAALQRLRAERDWAWRETIAALDGPATEGAAASSKKERRE